LQKGVLPVI